MELRWLFVVVIGACSIGLGEGGHEHDDYREALTKSIIFFEGQRSGHIPTNQRLTWRSHSALEDGKAQGVDLVGGYYDAGDHVKFGLPMAFTVTMLSWSTIEYGKQMEANGELSNAMDAIRWGTDYFIKAHPEPNVFYGEVGEGISDHYCWQRPEDMTTSRAAYRIDTANPGSDLAGETAAAMAAASIVFRRSDSSYSLTLLNHAKQLFEFADTYRGKYDSSIKPAQKYYQSTSGYADELLWAAAWLYQATMDSYYLDYLAKNGDSLGGTTWSITQFSWDVKYAGVQVLVSKFLIQGVPPAYTSTFEKYKSQAEFFMCSCIGKGSKNVRRTPGGLLFRQTWNNLQFVTTASFLLTVYSDNLTSARKAVTCPQGNAAPSELLVFAKSQVDYILGNNPRGTSYMVGYGNNYPKRIHHRGSSIVSIKVDPTFVSCRGGYDTWFSSKGQDPNLLVGAVVGGPGPYDDFADVRNNYEQTEPATYNNAPMLGVLARLSGGYGNLNQLLPGALPSPPPPKTALARRQAPSPLLISQTETHSWLLKQKTYFRYTVTVTNQSPKTVKNLKLSITNLYGPVWGLSKSGEFYMFPTWVTSLGPQGRLEFVYIHAAPLATITISRYDLV
ncbi:endoglucanase 19 [Amborella trichopoda]|nr:endoglucanase 19 [Amborella trichopoda]|eukprot:XP_020521688.1 endoglucanase 19 [Amborella trichopoda]